MTPTLIPIKQDKPGYDNFIGSWVCPGDLCVVVDVGPSRSVNLLVESLSGMGVERVDFVLLTHIHIDHAGGLAEFLSSFPMARVICHSKAISHLLDPTKLWEGSRKALGELVSTYGPISPVKEEWLIPHEEAKLPGLRIIETPGHAAHHLSYIYGGNLFAGEAGGVYMRLGTSDYVRPATPHPFFLKEFVESIDRLLAEGDLPICYGHFGRAERSHPMLKRATRQLLLWEKIIREHAASGEPITGCMEALLKEDPELRSYRHMSLADQERERFFMANSIKGYLDYLQKTPSERSYTPIRINLNGEM
jgi:glyoxylase-like metal-dependent hydrolase (beta-lactamase superfamily II)